MLGGKPTHPVGAIPGGLSKAITEEQRQRLLEIGEGFVEFGQFSLGLFEDVVLKNEQYMDLVLSDAFTHRTYYLGLMDDNNRVNFYDGHVRVVDPEGKEFVSFTPPEYTDVIAEHVEPWSYLKFPFLKKVGWKGLVDGADSGVYRAAPLARLNAAEGMATPLAQEAYDKMYSTFGAKPVHQTMAFHWARLIEMLYSGERVVELAKDPDITNPKVHQAPTATPDEGVGIVEAPRGLLIHHYQTDSNGIVQRANLIVGTTNNKAAICLSVKKAAEGFIKPGQEVSEGILNIVEMAFRAYDPCFGCATHALPGHMPLIVTIRDPRGEVIREIRRDG
jgi:F420-non-reducing hydrogenase large subunit